MRRPRLLPAMILAMAGLFLVKAETLMSVPRPPALAVIAPARAADPAPAAPSRPPAAAPVAVAPPAPPDPAAQAERALLEQLRARRTDIEAREQAVAAQEVMLQAAEARLTRRVEELTAMRQRLEALDTARGEREEAGWRGLVRTYEAMRPRDAATIFDELDVPVLVEILDRMADRKAAPVIGAMRPDRARMATAELARHRARRTTAD
jgi:flagellar motility protein MotE (MotC chaperone)